MAKLKILKVGDEALRKVCRPVENITPRVLQLLDDMVETMRAADGVGLAAPQVGILRRIVVIEPPDEGLFALINPKIIAYSGEQISEEGCLSVPGRWGTTKRPMHVTVRALNRKGETIDVTGSGLLAKAFCHEIDHLNGVVFKDVAERILTPKEVEEMENS